MSALMKMLMRVGAAVAVTAMLTGCAYELTEAERMTTEVGARDYAERSGGKFISCSGQDSDGDSYVTCSTQAKSGSSEDLLCSYRSRGCKRKS